ncbi:hypothetical protein [Silvimonas iriomotensis]|nr:hypothetical protein [Silvimonas iriomotensis]
MVLAQTAWFSALYYFFRVATQSHVSTVVACLAATVLPAGYGGLGIFSYAEPFLTARSVTEPLVLVALGLLVQERRIASFVVLLLAAPLHPLIAFSGLSVWFVHLVVFPPVPKVRWLLLGLALASMFAVTALAFAQVKPFGTLLQTYDAKWWSLVEAFNRQVMITRWSRADLVRLGSVLTLFLACSKITMDPRTRRVMTSLMGATVVSMAVSVVFGDWLRNVFALSIQIWRILSPLQALIPGLAVGLLIRQRRTIPGNLQAAIALAVISLLMQSQPISFIYLLIAEVLIYAPVLKIGQPVRKLLLVCLTLAVLLALFNDALQASEFILRQFPDSPFQWAYPHLLATGVAALVLVLAIRLQSTYLLLGVAALSVVTAGVIWDRRSALEAFYENAQGQNPFEQFIGPNDNVYWNAFRPMPWLVFSHSSYVSGMVAAPILFNRAYAGEYAQRYTLVEAHYMARDCAGFQFMGGQCDDNARTINAGFCAIDSRLRWIVSAFRNESLPVTSTWRFNPGGHQGQFYLYDCTQLRKLPAYQQFISDQARQ